MVDPHVADWQFLAASAKAQGRTVLVLNAEQDGIAQVGAALAAGSDWTGVHFFSHGSADGFQLGGSQIDRARIGSYADEVRQWRGSLASGADLLFYECGLAGGSAGRSLLDDFRAWTGADVAASTNVTGAAALGGDWVLEYQRGAIETGSPLTAAEQGAYAGTFATFTVTNTGDSGAGSLRQAIADANAADGADTIEFNLSNADPNFDAMTGKWTITLAAALDVVTESVTIDGSTQAGYAGAPLVVVNGSGINSNGIDLGIGSSGSTVRGLVINGFSGAGVHIASANNFVQGNWIGLNASGTAAAANTTGVLLDNASGNTVGGATAADRNVISGNGEDGVSVSGAMATGNTILGNYIGLDPAGVTAIGNAYSGVLTTNGATGTTVGGTAPGAGNLISGNAEYGVRIEADNTTVKGNVIGLFGDGSVSATSGNHIGGVLVSSANNTIGGAAARNVISGNGGAGVHLQTSGATGNVLQGNYIGTDTAGSAATGFGNARGVLLDNGASGNTVGGAAAGAGNVISGNAGAGVDLNGAAGNTLLGNIIGLDGSGTVALPNSQGVTLINAPDTVIGGSAAGEGNVISGNSQNGIGSDGNGVSGTRIQGNYIGTNAAGTAAVGNAGMGISIDTSSGARSTGLTIGGTTAGAGNLISGNGSSAILLQADNTLIAGNIIGLNAAGTATLPNGGGIILASASNNTIGGTTALARNVISGNLNEGFRVFSATTSGNVIQGNYIGTDGAGSSTPGFGNGSHGVWLNGTNNTVGGAAPGAGNVIAFNNGSGVIIESGSGQSILQNSIYGNTSLGINLGNTVTNDGAVSPGEPNLRTDFPVFTTANLVGSTLTVAGYVGSAAGQATFSNNRVEVFISDTSSANGSGRTYIGFLTTNASGNFSGSLSVAGLGLTAADSLTATATDESGNTSEFGTNRAVNGEPVAVADAAMAVEAGGTNNGTPGTDPTGNVLANDTDPDGGDTKVVTGVVAGNAGSASGSVGVTVTGTYGSVVVNANGSFTYTVNNANAAVQALRTSSDTLTDTFTYTLTDGGGLTSTAQLTVTIHGANDIPTGGAVAATAAEAGGLDNLTPGLNPTGTVFTNISDVDSGDTFTVTGVAAGVAGSASGAVGSPVAGAYGSLTVRADGTFVYTVDNASASVQALRAGDSVTDTFTYTAADLGGLTVTAQVTVTIQGAADAPGAAVLVAGGTVPLNAVAGTVVGQVAASIADAGATVGYALVTSANGLFTIDSSGRIAVAPGAVFGSQNPGAYNLIVRTTGSNGTARDQTITLGVEVGGSDRAVPRNGLTPVRFADGRIGFQNSAGQLVRTVAPPAGYGSFQVAIVPDRTGDGIDDLLVGGGSGIGSRVGIFDGATGAELLTWSPFSAGFIGGVSVACGDVTGDGVADFIIGAGPGAGPHVKVFDGVTGAERASFFAYDSRFRGGVSVAVGDVTRDGFADIVTAAGPGTAPHVKVFSGRFGEELMSFFAYDRNFFGGVRVSIRDVNADGLPDIITEATVTGRTHVKAFDTLTGEIIQSYFSS
ncbi:DUF4347 domain-containing protein [Gemmata sp. JC717]|uniref:DUF4347 domain-containing protein n=1 Tax=Gemmata algarum TaxID=2975278 RepID=UPI0021BB1F75|nr:DUF4347 domain-containing protein [Gemmata algarum]MDY3556247.1 DUF4347 domain-containing protein [Gemmata algarum]